jgi:ABC-type polar amino acid transport system ATPase subunit
MNHPGSVTAGGDAPAIEIRGLEKRFGSLEVLRGVSLDIATGEALVIVGPSGGGKSTLLRCLSMLEQPNGGEILVNGHPLGGGRRGEIGMVFQQFNLFPHRTAVDNISLAPRLVQKMPRREANLLALELLERMGMRDKAGSYPMELSGGQQQRVAIARSLAMSPAVMLFDEVTSALDRELVYDVLRVMRQLAEDGMTMIVVTHELWFAENVADRVVLLAEGEVVEAGTPEEFFRNPKTDRARRFLREIVPEADPGSGTHDEPPA